MSDEKIDTVLDGKPSNMSRSSWMSKNTSVIYSPHSSSDISSSFSIQFPSNIVSGYRICRSEVGSCSSHPEEHLKLFPSLVWSVEHFLRQAVLVHFLDVRHCLRRRLARRTSNLPRYLICCHRVGSDNSPRRIARMIEHCSPIILDFVCCSNTAHPSGDGETRLASIELNIFPGVYPFFDYENAFHPYK